MPFIFLFLFASFAWSQDCTENNPNCSSLSTIAGQATTLSALRNLCTTSGGLIQNCQKAGKVNDYCIFQVSANNYHVRGTCFVAPPPPPSSSSVSVVVPPDPPPPPVSSASPPLEYSSTSWDCPSNEFNPVNVLNGFSDYWEVFYLIFACFILVKLVNMIK